MQLKNDIPPVDVGLLEDVCQQGLLAIAKADAAGLADCALPVFAATGVTLLTEAGVPQDVALNVLWRAHEFLAALSKLEALATSANLYRATPDGKGADIHPALVIAASRAPCTYATGFDLKRLMRDAVAERSRGGVS